MTVKAKSFAYRLFYVTVVSLTVISLYHHIQRHYSNRNGETAGNDGSSTHQSIPTQPPKSFEELYKEKESEIRERFRQRRQRLTDVCDEHFSPDYNLNWRTFTKHRKDWSESTQFWWERLYVVPKAKIVFCSIPQVDSIDWVRHLTLLGQQADNDKTELKGYDWFNIMVKQLIPLSRFRTEKAKAILRDFKRVIWVRDPLERVVLSWHEKVAPLLSGNLLPPQGAFNDSSEEQSSTSFTLETFFNLMINEPSSWSFDKNWRPYRDLCAVCQLPYDYIMYRETEKNVADLPLEVGYIFKESLKRDDLPIFNVTQPVISQSEKMLDQQLLDQVTKPLLHRILDIYKLDYALFGFERPEKDQMQGNNN